VNSGDIHVTGNIDNSSLVFLQSTSGNIIIDGKIDGGSRVTLKAKKGNVSIGTTGGIDDKKIDGNSQVQVIAGGSISLGSYIHKATVDFSAHGSITLGAEIDYDAAVRHLADGNISIGGKIDGSSRAELVSNRGSVTIQRKVDGGSKVWLSAAGDIRIGQTGGDGDRKIDGNSFVSATAGGLINLGSYIHKDHTVVDFAACGSITIGKGIANGATVRLVSAAKKITLTDPIADSGTRVTSWPPKALVPTVQGGATFVESDWAAVGPGAKPLCLAKPMDGWWWENWGQTFGYVVPKRVIPRSLDDLVKAIIGSGNVDRPETTPVKAVGGGWSFTDASLPIQQADDVEKISILDKGRPGQQDLHDILQGLSDSAAAPMDLFPGAVARNSAFSTMYNQKTMRQVTKSGIQLPSIASKARLIDTRSLACSLQCEFPNIQTAPPTDPTTGLPVFPPEILFHVEAGITMADLQQLLDHQRYVDPFGMVIPRLAIRATGGSPGATLAGALSTATHGGEFRADWPLLVDCVRAIHLVGPGGEQWWIEGVVPVADPTKLQLRYGKFGPFNFIGGKWSAIPWSGIPGLEAQDVLDAVTVSMGTMGVIYSVVLAVVPQFGLRQIVHPTTWADLLKKAGITQSQLQAGNAAANTKLLDTLMDGKVNGTGIAKADNVFIDLAINPINEDCWIFNRELTPGLPDDDNSPATSIDDYLTALRLTLSGHDDVGGDKLLGRIADFLQWGTDPVNFALHGGGKGGNLVSFVTRLPDVLVGGAATGAVQAVANIANDPGDPDRGLAFFGDLLSGFFHALEGTLPGVTNDQGLNSDVRLGKDGEGTTAVSYKLGAIGWPDTGVPGRGLEIALDPTNAFTFLQTVLLDDVLTNVMRKGNNPLIGYISVRVCPPTKTLMGMQQYSPQSVMIEVVAYRSPEANKVMDAIQDGAIKFSGPGPKPMLHWGLENEKVTAGHLKATPLGQPYKAGMSKLDAFRAIRTYLRKGYPPVFDNAFSNRMAL